MRGEASRRRLAAARYCRAQVRPKSRSVLVEIGLIAALVISLWLAVDAARAQAPWRRRLPVKLLGVSIGAWSLGELMCLRAATPDELVLARRVLFAGSISLPIVWMWLATEVTRGGWLRNLQGRVAWLGIPGLLAYSCLYWDHDVRFVSWTARPPQHGPVFFGMLAYGYALVAVGSVGLVVAARRMARVSSLRLGLVSSAICIPLLGNLWFHVFGTGAVEPTPILVGLAALVLRLSVFDSGLAAFLPIARRDVIEQLDSGVVVADFEGTVVDANAAAARFVPGRLLGRSLAEVLEHAHSVPGRILEVQTSAVHGRLGEVGRFALLTDRTASRRSEQQLLQAHKLEALGILTAGIAHEVNNPLAFVRANLSGLEDLATGLREATTRALLPPKLAELAADAPDLVAESIEGVERIGRLVRRLRRFARADGGAVPYERVDLRDVAEKAVTLAGVGLAPGAIRRVLHPVPPVLGNEDELVQIAVNLLVNALQASDGRPVIEVEVKALRGGASLAVRDRGAGIPAEALPRLFDPFFTTKPPGQGTGLGLSLSFDLARQHGGTLEGGNREGGGAEFELWLPA